MSWITWMCLGLVLLGVALFLYGANVYDAVVGWTGFFLGMAGILVFLSRYIYGELTKKPEPQNP
jgi:membrane-bound ClpP family serine protease